MEWETTALLETMQEELGTHCWDDHVDDDIDNGWNWNHPRKNDEGREEDDDVAIEAPTPNAATHWKETGQYHHRVEQSLWCQTT